VFVNTIAAISAAAIVPPELNPYQPNNNNAAPIATNPILKGPCSFLNFLSPNTYIPPKHPNPDVICITAPPAKSTNPNLLKNPPPHTQCATGK